ncbi:MAG: M20/M25/M40 family metallo-hydrolase [Lachnospiraceae bacterium]|nr:M20/M25/M40 family metallo-hydrolase [Lachnospiraceae bacterium]
MIFTAEGYGAKVTVGGEYPGWEYVPESLLRDKMQTLYREMYGKAMKVRAIHAGLECGIFASKLPGLDAVSMGPDIYEIHTPGEHLSVSSLSRVYEYLVRLIALKDE